MGNVKISVIIPVYNCENLLRRCLISVVKQTLQEIEIIVINDCSNDNSQAILNEYAISDIRFTLLQNSKNEGVGTTRNKGLEIAKGEYVIFIDADDYWSDINMLAYLYDLASRNNADIVNFGLRKLNMDGQVQFIMAGNPGNIDMLQNNDWRVKYSPAVHLLSKKLLDKYNVRFNPHLEMGEDALFNHIVYCNASRLTITDKVFYNYQTNPQSLNCIEWSKSKLFCTVLWFELAIEIIVSSPAFTRKPGLLQELMNERIKMLTHKLARLALTVFDEPELQQYIDKWTRCFEYLDTKYFDTHFFPHGWPTLYRNTFELIKESDHEGFQKLFSKKHIYKKTHTNYFKP